MAEVFAKGVHVGFTWGNEVLEGKDRDDPDRRIVGSFSLDMDTGKAYRAIPGDTPGSFVGVDPIGCVWHMKIYIDQAELCTHNQCVGFITQENDTSPYKIWAGDPMSPRFVGTVTPGKERHEWSLTAGCAALIFLEGSFLE